MQLQDSNQVVSKWDWHSKPLLRCKPGFAVLDISGSMCVHYSTLGKKVDHKLLKEDGPANNLLLIYLVYHKNRGTALLLRENLKAFSTEYLEGLAKEAGYQHLASIIVEASDAGLSVNPRCRRHLACTLRYLSDLKQVPTGGRPGAF